MHDHPIIQKLNEFCNIPENLAPQILDAFKVKKLQKEKTVVREGFTNRSVYFLHTGIIRRYHISQLGHQKTTAFVTSNNFFTDLKSFQTRKSSATSFNTETDCTIYSIDFFVLQALKSIDPTINEAFTKAQDYYVKLAEDQTHFLTTEPVESRVKMMAEELPTVIAASRKRDIISYLRTNSQTYNFILKNLQSPRS